MIPQILIAAWLALTFGTAAFAAWRGNRVYFGRREFALLAAGAVAEAAVLLWGGFWG